VKENLHWLEMVGQDPQAVLKNTAIYGIEPRNNQQKIWYAEHAWKQAILECGIDFLEPFL
jgi:hypothetical protein